MKRILSFSAEYLDILLHFLILFFSSSCSDERVPNPDWYEYIKNVMNLNEGFKIIRYINSKNRITIIFIRLHINLTMDNRYFSVLVFFLGLSNIN